MDTMATPITGADTITRTKRIIDYQLLVNAVIWILLSRALTGIVAAKAHSEKVSVGTALTHLNSGAYQRRDNDNQ